PHVSGLDFAAQKRQNLRILMGNDWAMRSLRALLLGLGGLILAGCVSASSPQSLAANDPFEKTNRDILVLNQKFDQIFFIPTLNRYRKLPEAVRNGVHNFLRNLAGPTIFVNDLMQGETERAGTTLARF